MIILEPDVTLTDFGLAIECAWLAVWLHRRPLPGGPLDTWFVIFFGAVGIGALLGGIKHGFLSDTQSVIHGVVWKTTLIAIGIAALSTWIIGGRLLFSERAANRIPVFAVSLLTIYVATVLWVSQSFIVAIVYYVPATAFLLTAFFLIYLRHPRNYLVAGIFGLAMVFVAAVIQQSKASILSLGLNHNAVYHLVQAIALGLVFVAARGLSRENACQRDVTS